MGEAQNLHVRGVKVKYSTTYPVKVTNNPLRHQILVDQQHFVFREV